MRFLKEAVVIGVLAALGGCGTISNKLVSDQELARRAAFALDTTPEKVTISDRAGEISPEINFVANTGVRKHQCYISSLFGIMNSSAICSGANSVNSSNCNALLKAAGQCQ